MVVSLQFPGQISVKCCLLRCVLSPVLSIGQLGKKQREAQSTPRLITDLRQTGRKGSNRTGKDEIKCPGKGEKDAQGMQDIWCYLLYPWSWEYRQAQRLTQTAPGSRFLSTSFTLKVSSFNYFDFLWVGFLFWSILWPYKKCVDQY